MTATERSLVLSTPQLDCEACQTQSIHTAEDWKLHPYAGHGFSPERGWSHPNLGKAK
jgi:hypothetical protein